MTEQDKPEAEAMEGEDVTTVPREAPVEFEIRSGDGRVIGTAIPGTVQFATVPEEAQPAPAPEQVAVEPAPAPGEVRLAEVPLMIQSKTPFTAGTMHGRRARDGRVNLPDNDGLPAITTFQHIPHRSDYVLLSGTYVIGWFDTETQHWIEPEGIHSVTAGSRTVRRHAALMRDGFALARGETPVQAQEPVPEPPTPAIPPGVPLEDTAFGLYYATYVGNIRERLPNFNPAEIDRLREEMAAAQRQWDEWMEQVNTAANVVAKSHGWCGSFEGRVRPIGLKGRRGY